MNFLKTGPLILLSALLATACSEVEQDQKHFNTANMMIRLAELEIDSAYLNEYMTILKEEAAASIRLEPGVICIYPMFQKENPTQDVSDMTLLLMFRLIR